MFATPVPQGFIDASKCILVNNWNWGFEEFCRRCRIDGETEYAKRQWQAFQSLHRALHDIDNDILAVVAAPETTVVSVTGRRSEQS